MNLIRLVFWYHPGVMVKEHSKNAKDRVAVFVDGANLYHSIKNYYSGMLDYDRLLSEAVGGRSLLRATFYIVEKVEMEETSGGSARSFVYNLNKFGYKVRSKPLAVHETLSPNGEKTVSHKGDWDVGIVVDMFRLADHADTYVLVSGDGDYVEAVDFLQSEKGIRVEVISASQCTSQSLFDVCDSHTDLADIPDLFRGARSGGHQKTFGHTASEG
ncbi:MAG: NYN domain-containing protein [Actinomycetota bacterium]|nr:NYN domain-containing protein [Actinomycetota bacterium]